MPASNIPKGYGLIPGRSPEAAKRALQAAEDAGLAATVVRTVGDGYIVPEKVLKAYEAATQDSEKQDSKKTEKEPEPSTKTAAKKTAASRKKE